MSTQINAKFETANWDEGPFSEIAGGPKLTRALVTGKYSGEIEGKTTIAFLMAYPSDETANYSGLERIEGQIGKRKGSFVLRHEGTFSDGKSRTKLTVVPDSGTGDLAGLSGKGTAEAPIGSTATVVLDVDFS